MKLADLITKRKRCRLTHPVVGNVVWDRDNLGCFCLQFAQGHEKGRPLVVDESVMLDDTWELGPKPRVDFKKAFREGIRRAKGK